MNGYIIDVNHANGTVIVTYKMPHHQACLPKSKLRIPLHVVHGNNAVIRKRTRSVTRTAQWPFKPKVVGSNPIEFIARVAQR